MGRGLTAAALKQLDLENNENYEEDDLRSVASRYTAFGSKAYRGIYYAKYYVWGMVAGGKNLNEGAGEKFKLGKGKRLA